VIIDCQTCQVRGDACGDCVVTALLGAPPTGLEFDAVECRALHVLAESGLVPPLRLVPGDPPGQGEGTDEGGDLLGAWAAG
jgi:hypothetical protein